MVSENVELKNVTIGRGSYRNFSGTVGMYNKSGDRKFSIFLPQEVADELLELGWYVKTKPGRREGDDPINQFDIAVAFDPYPPTIELISHDGTKSYLTEETVGILDELDIARADLEIRPYNWNVNGKTGVKAYLKTLKVHARPPRRSLNASMGGNDEAPF